MTEAENLQKEWGTDPRWQGIVRPYTAEDVLRLRGSLKVAYTLADHSARKFWRLLQEKDFIAALSAVTGNQAVQEVAAGLHAVYVSGWQVAADQNTSLHTYPDQSLYPADSVPKLVRRINNALTRADQICYAKGKRDIDWFVPLIADAEAGFGGILNVFELMKDMIEAGASTVHLEDQLSSAKKCGHLGGKVVIPTNEFVKKLIAARLATDVLGVPTLIIARTDANGAKLLANDIDERDRQFATCERTEEGFYHFHGGLDAAIARGLAYAPYSDLIWCETSTPNVEEARKFAEQIHAQYPGKLLAYNCSPSFNWKKNLDDATIAEFQRTLAGMGYKFQFITLSGFHVLNYSMFTLARSFAHEGMPAYVRLQQDEFGVKTGGYTATEHQEFVGTGWFDEVNAVISGGDSSTLAMKGSTEKEQFDK